MVSGALGAVDWDNGQRSSPDSLVHRMYCVLLVCTLPSKLAVRLNCSHSFFKFPSLPIALGIFIVVFSFFFFFFLLFGICLSYIIVSVIDILLRYQ